MLLQRLGPCQGLWTGASQLSKGFGMCCPHKGQVASRPGSCCTMKIEGRLQISAHEVRLSNNMEHHKLHPGPWMRIEGLEVLRFASILVQDLGGQLEVQDDA